MEIIIIHDEKFIIKQYQIRDKAFWIGASIETTLPNHIRLSSKRPIQIHNSSINHIIRNDNFFTDIDFLVDFFKSKNEFNDGTITMAFLEICAKHITSKERLIDNDMYVFVDETLLVAQNIYFNILDQDLTNEICKKAYPELVKHCLTYLKNYIYVTKYEGILSDPYLVKFTDL